MECLNRPCQNCNKPMNGGLYRARHICPHCLFEHEELNNKRKRRSTAATTHVEPMSATITTAPQAEITAVAPRTVEPTIQARPMEAAKFDAAASVPVQPAAQTAPRAASADEAVQPVTTSAKPAGKESAKPKVENSKSVLASGERAQPSDEMALIPKVSQAKTQEPNIILTSRSLEEYAELDIIDNLKSECVLSVRLSPDMFVNGKFVGNKHDRIKAALDQGKKQVLVQLRQQALKHSANMVTNIEFKNSMKLLDREQARITVSAAGTAAKVEVTEIAMGA